MRIGLLADIHEAVPQLRWALTTLKDQRADFLVVLGDIFDTGKRLDETVSLLIEAGATLGVWGNHDFGLCSRSPIELGAAYEPTTVAYMRGLQARLEFANVLFQHILPCYDSEQLEDLWSCHHDEMNEPDILGRIFNATTFFVTFVGHFHRWIHATPVGRTEWAGKVPLKLDPRLRHLVVVQAVVDGACAIFDTEESQLIPFNL